MQAGHGLVKSLNWGNEKIPLKEEKKMKKKKKKEVFKGRRQVDFLAKGPDEN